MLSNLFECSRDTVAEAVTQLEDEPLASREPVYEFVQPIVQFLLLGDLIGVGCIVVFEVVTEPGPRPRLRAAPATMCR